MGKPMRPDVAHAFDRMAAAAAREAGLFLSINSAFRSDAEQARLFAANPDPKWVTPPGTACTATPPNSTSARRGVRLAGRERRPFGFIQKYKWEPWHFGYARNTGSASVGFGGRGDGRRAVPSFVPAEFHQPIVRAAQRCNVGAALLSAQITRSLLGSTPFGESRRERGSRVHAGHGGGARSRDRSTRRRRSIYRRT